MLVFSGWTPKRFFKLHYIYYCPGALRLVLEFIVLVIIFLEHFCFGDALDFGEAIYGVEVPFLVGGLFVRILDADF